MEEPSVIIDTHLILTNVSPDLAERLIDRHARFRNPEWEASKRYSPSGRPARGVAEFIDLSEYDATRGTLKLPRGLVSPIHSIFSYQHVQDNRVFPDLYDGQRPCIDAKYEPRPYQIAAVAAVRAAGGGIIQAGTGTGKTVIALELSRQLMTPTLFLVHTQSLLTQTVTAVREKLGIEPGIIGGGKWAPDWFTVATLQTLDSRGVGDLADRFGLVIMDEAHHCPAKTFAAIVQQFPARYRVGLTATPKRADGLTGMLTAVIGPVVYKLDSALLPLEFHKVETPFKMAKVPERKARFRKSGMVFSLDGQPDRKPDINYTELLNVMCADTGRTRFICDYIADKHHAMSLVITERIGHAEQITRELQARNLNAVMLAGPGANFEIRRDVADGIAEGRYSVLVSTSGMVGEGFDLPKLDSIFLAAPHSQPTKTQQIAGRVLRPHAMKTCGRIYDFVDVNIPFLVGQWVKRARVYRRLAGGK